MSSSNNKYHLKDPELLFDNFDNKPRKKKTSIHRRQNKRQGNSTLSAPSNCPIYRASQKISTIVCSREIQSASVFSKKWQIPLEHALLALNRISPDQYARILADSFRIEFIHPRWVLRPLIEKKCSEHHKLLKSGLWIERNDGRRFLCLPAEILTPQFLSEILLETRSTGLPIAITTRDKLVWLLGKSYNTSLTNFAINGLDEKFPGESAGHSTGHNLYVRFARIFVPFIFGLVVVAPPDPIWIAIPLTILFQLHSVLRLLACGSCT
ncbi:MAG: hypothetical protein ACR2OW_08250, partial [Methyloligellaceae bacterium]